MTLTLAIYVATCFAQVSDAALRQDIERVPLKGAVRRIGNKPWAGARVILHARPVQGVVNQVI